MPDGMSGTPWPWLGTALGGGGVLSSTLDFGDGGSLCSLSNFGMVFASVFGSGGFSFGGSSWYRLFVGSAVSLGVTTAGLGIGRPALLTSVAFVIEPRLPVPDHWSR